MLVVDEQGRVLSDDERLAALRRHGLEVDLTTEPHAWSIDVANPAGVECDFRDRSNQDEPEQERNWGDVRINVRPIKVQDSEDQQAAEVA